MKLEAENYSKRSIRLFKNYIKPVGKENEVFQHVKIRQKLTD